MPLSQAVLLQLCREHNLHWPGCFRSFPAEHPGLLELQTREAATSKAQRGIISGSAVNVRVVAEQKLSLSHIMILAFLKAPGTSAPSKQ